MTKYVEELIAIIRGNLSREELIDRLFDTMITILRRLWSF